MPTKYAVYTAALSLLVSLALPLSATVAPVDPCPTLSDSNLVLADKTHTLSSKFVPKSLVYPKVPVVTKGATKNQLAAPAAAALVKLFAAGKKAGYTYYLLSGYRSYATQKSLFAAYAKSYGEVEANTFSAKPGTSEHQTGLALDVTTKAMHYGLSISFGDTAEGTWLKEHAPEYGFVVSYPNGATDRTGYQYEPWHIRYVGVDNATYMTEKNLILKEYRDEVSARCEKK